MAKGGMLMVTRHGDLGVVSIQQKQFLNDEVINRFAEEAMDLIESQGYAKLVLDFANVEYLSSKMLGKLMALYKRVQAEKGGLALCNVRKDLREVFEVTQLDTVLNLHADQGKAIKSLEQKKRGWFR